MSYEVPEISPDGKVQLDRAYFGWWIDLVIEECVDQLNCDEDDTDRDFRFLNGAYRLAREAIATGLSWVEVGTAYALAAAKLPIGRSKTTYLLALAHTFASSRFHHWTDLGRQWVCVGEDLQMLHIATGEVLDDLQFCVLFKHLGPDEDQSVLSFLLEVGAVECVEAIEYVPGALPMFVGESGDLELRLPQLSLACSEPN